MGCLAFCHSRWLISGVTWNSKVTLKAYSFLEIPFITDLVHLDTLFSSLNNIRTYVSDNNGSINITMEWINKIVKVTLQGYSRICACQNIKYDGNFTDINYHINWTRCSIIFL